MTSCRSINRWQQVDEGLAIGEFEIAGAKPFQKTSLFIIKIDPLFYEFKLLSASELGRIALTTKQWSKKYNLITAINAGMYQTDMMSNVGFMKNFEHKNNTHINSTHKSLAVFNPKENTDPPFYMHDLDETNVDSILIRYNTAIQNLRLIKRPAENRWEKQNEKWSEAALGQEVNGNVLFIYSRRPVSMYDFNQALLRLPINIVCAQHLDGGPHASLYFSHNGLVRNYQGAVSLNHDMEEIIQGIALPNIIGVRKRNKNK
jgi:uncharacterized protein YigE (DUF2233 family)